jgi:uncharacterized C2H2 Zn-finger protein
MPIIVLCSHCQSKSQVGEQFAGKLVKCPRCGQAFTATPAAPSAHVAAQPIPAPPPLPADVVQGELLTPEEEARFGRPNYPERREMEPAPPRESRPADAWDDDRRRDAGEGARRRGAYDRDVDYRAERDDDTPPGTMPPSVRTAVVAMSISLALELGLFLLILILLGAMPTDRSSQFIIFPLVGGVVGGLILWGLIAGHRLAWQWGRVFGYFAGILVLIGSIVIIAVPQPQEPLGVRLFVGGIRLVDAVLMLTIAISLGTRPAKIYFNLRCPRCGVMTNLAADFFFNEARCRRCDCSW